jgi:hypothetical protein
LIDELLDSTEKRLAWALLLLACYLASRMMGLLFSFNGFSRNKPAIDVWF